MTETDPIRQLHTLIDEGVELLCALEKLLADERQAVEKRDRPALEQSTAEKTALLPRVEANFRARQQWMSAQGIESSADGWQAFVEQQPGAERPDPERRLATAERRSGTYPKGQPHQSTADPPQPGKHHPSAQPAAGQEPAERTLWQLRPERQHQHPEPHRQGLSILPLAERALCRYNARRLPIVQWIEQTPPKG